MSFDSILDYVRGHIWLSVTIVVGAILLIIGLVNYIRALSDKGSKSTASRPSKPPKVKGKQLLPSWMFIVGIVILILPFLLRGLELAFNFHLSDYISLDYWGGGDWPFYMAEYNFQMWLFNVSAVFATVLLFVAFYRRRRSTGWGVIKTLIVYFFTYNLATRFVYRISLMVGNSVFGSHDSAMMIYAAIVYLYLIIWALVYKAQSKKT